MKILEKTKKRMVSVLLVALMTISMVACGSETSTTSNEATIDGSTSSGSDIVASIENSSSIETQDVAAVEETSVEEETLGPEYEEYEYFYKDKNFVWEGEIILDYKSSNPTDNMVEFEDVEDLEMYGLYDSLDTYAGTGAVNGYTKPNIVVQLRATSDDWVLVTFESDGSTYLKRKDFEENSVLVTDMDGSGNYIIPEKGSTTTSSETTSTSSNTSSNETTTSNETNTNSNTTTNETSTNVSSSTPTNEVETQVVEVDDKYTPEEAVAAYRAIMESNGMTWDPSLPSDGASWGTGWIYLKKSSFEEQVQSALKGYAYGDGQGNPTTRYYFEVTGSDDNKVNVTVWGAR